MPCVGVVALAGCFALVIAPDPAGTVVSSKGPLPVVVVDPGHGGIDSGARSGGVMEKTLTLDLARRLEGVLRARGFSVVPTRTADVYVPLAERSAVANRVRGPAIFVSLHFNQGGGRGVAGIETLYADNKPESWMWMGVFDQSGVTDDERELAGAVQKALIERTGWRDRGIRARHLYVTRHTRLPSILVEGGFVNNPAEVGLLRGAYADREARAIADGIEAWCRSRGS